MSIFVSYDSKDISHVNSLSNINKQNSILKRRKLWIAFEKKSGVKNIPPGEEYIKEIQSNIKDSKGAVLFISKNFLENDFINTYELPLIIDKWKTEKNYKILPIFVDNVSIPKESLISKIQFINSPSTSLSSLKGSQYTLVLEEALENAPKSNFFIKNLTSQLSSKYKSLKLPTDTEGRLQLPNIRFVLFLIITVLLVVMYYFFYFPAFYSAQQEVTSNIPATTIAPTTTTVIKSNVGIEAGIGFQSNLIGNGTVSYLDFNDEFIFLTTKESCTGNAEGVFYVPDIECDKFLYKLNKSFEVLQKINLVEKIDCTNNASELGVYVLDQSILINCLSNNSFKLSNLKFSGEIIWERYFSPIRRSGDGISINQIDSVDYFNNNIYVVINSSDSFTDDYFGEQDSFIFKLNNSGETIWVKSFSTIYDEMISNIYINESGIFTCKQFSRSQNKQPQITKIDFDGNVLWNFDFEYEWRQFNCAGFYMFDSAYYVRLFSNFEKALFLKFDTDGTILDELNYANYNDTSDEINRGGVHYIYKDYLIVFGTADSSNQPIGEDLGGDDLYYLIYSGFGQKELILEKASQFGTNYNENAWGVASTSDGELYLIGRTDGDLFREKNDSDYDFFVQNFTVVENP